MQKRRSKNLRRNIGKIWKMWQDKNAKKEHSSEENYQGSSQQKYYMDGQTGDMTRNTGEG